MSTARTPVERRQQAMRRDYDGPQRHALTTLHQRADVLAGDVGLADGTGAEVHDLRTRRIDQRRHPTRAGGGVVW